MNYKDTILKQSQIKWEAPKIKYIDDGNVDFHVTVPLTNLLNMQAQTSFTHGVLEMFKFTALAEEPLTSEVLANKFSEWGLSQQLIQIIFKKL